MRTLGTGMCKVLLVRGTIRLRRPAQDLDRFSVATEGRTPPRPALPRATTYAARATPLSISEPDGQLDLIYNLPVAQSLACFSRPFVVLLLAGRRRTRLPVLALARHDTCQPKPSREATSSWDLKAPGQGAQWRPSSQPQSAESAPPIDAPMARSGASPKCKQG